MHLHHNTLAAHYNQAEDVALRAGQAAVAEARRLLHNGIGNQRAAILSTGGASAEETTRARASYIPDPNPIIWIAQQAIAAMRSGSGNCDECGALAFCLLHCWRVGPISFVHGTGHTFAVIHAGNSGVLVDPWLNTAEVFPQNPTGMLQVQNFWRVDQPNGCLLEQFGNMVANFDAMSWQGTPNNAHAQHLAAQPGTY